MLCHHRRRLVWSAFINTDTHCPYLPNDVDNNSSVPQRDLSKQTGDGSGDEAAVESGKQAARALIQIGPTCEPRVTPHVLCYCVVRTFVHPSTLMTNLVSGLSLQRVLVSILSVLCSVPSELRCPRSLLFIRCSLCVAPLVVPPCRPATQPAACTCPDAHHNQCARCLTTFPLALSFRVTDPAACRPR